MKIISMCLGNFYIDNMSYQENILPKYYAKLGYQVEIIASQYCFDGTGNVFYREASSYINENGIPVVVLPYKKNIPLSKQFKLYKGIYSEIEKFGPDIIFIHGGQFPGNKEVIKYKKRHPYVRLLCDNHSDYYNTPLSGHVKYFIMNSLFWPHIVHRLGKWTDFFWGVTPLRVDYLLNVYKIPMDKVGLLIMGGDDEKIHYDKRFKLKQELRREYHINNDEKIIVTGGKIGKGKNIEGLVGAIEKLSSSVQLFVFGDFMIGMEKLKERCEKNRNIHLMGWLNDEATYNLFLASDLAIFPGTHSVLWEQAAACGLPCILKSWQGMRHIDIDGNCIFLEVADEQEIYTVLYSLVSDNQRYNELLEKANEARTSFLYSTIAKKSLSIEK